MSGDCNVCINGKLPSYSPTCAACGLSRKNFKPITNTAKVEAEWTEDNTCSHCGDEACAGYDEEPWLTRYCPHCGAKMKNPEEYE